MMENWFRTLGPPPDVPSLWRSASRCSLSGKGRRLFAALYRAPRTVAIALLGVLAFALSRDTCTTTCAVDRASSTRRVIGSKRAHSPKVT